MVSQARAALPTASCAAWAVCAVFCDTSPERRGQFLGGTGHGVDDLAGLLGRGGDRLGLGLGVASQAFEVFAGTDQPEYPCPEADYGPPDLLHQLLAGDLVSARRRHGCR